MRNIHKYSVTQPPCELLILIKDALLEAHGRIHKLKDALTENDKYLQKLHNSLKLKDIK